jgi:hypothetical protein
MRYACTQILPLHVSGELLVLSLRGICESHVFVDPGSAHVSLPTLQDYDPLNLPHLSCIVGLRAHSGCQLLSCVHSLKSSLLKGLKQVHQVQIAQQLCAGHVYSKSEPQRPADPKFLACQSKTERGCLRCSPLAWTRARTEPLRGPRAVQRLLKLHKT